MAKWWNFCNGDLVKCQNVMVSFSYLIWLLSFPFMDVLTRSGGGCPYQFLLHIRPSGTLHLHIRLPLSLPHNLSPHHSLLSITLNIPLRICPPCATLSISFYLPLSLPHHLLPSHELIPITINLPHNLSTPIAHLSLYLPLHLPHPPYLSQRLPRCHSYMNMIQIMQLI